MDNPLYTAKVIADDKEVEVYKQSSTGHWVDYKDCKTVYTPNQLTQLKIKR